MEVMYWKFPHIQGEWKVYNANTLCTGEGVNLALLHVKRWEGTVPVVGGVGIDGAWDDHKGERVHLTPVKEAAVPGAKKFDGDKPMLDLLIDGCPDALLGVAAALTYGYKKYGGKHGWKSLPDAEARYTAAMLRHQLAIATGELNDPESGLPHADHVACNALFLAQLSKEGKCN